MMYLTNKVQTLCHFLLLLTAQAIQSPSCSHYATASPPALLGWTSDASNHAAGIPPTHSLNGILLSCIGWAPLLLISCLPPAIAAKETAKAALQQKQEVTLTQLSLAKFKSVHYHQERKEIHLAIVPALVVGRSRFVFFVGDWSMAWAA